MISLLLITAEAYSVRARKRVKSESILKLVIIQKLLGDSRTGLLIVKGILIH